MLLWFVDEEVAMRAIDGELIDETSVEVHPTNLCNGVADENINLEAILTSAVGTGPSPMWQSNTKHYNFF